MKKAMESGREEEEQGQARGWGNGEEEQDASNLGVR